MKLKEVSLSANKRFVLLVILFLMSQLLINAVDTEKYTHLTDRDRVITALSYYEAGIRYREINNTSMADSMIRMAEQIVPDVKEYYDGNIQIPQKTIQLDLQSIFSPVTETSPR